MILIFINNNLEGLPDDQLHCKYFFLEMNKFHYLNIKIKS